MLTLAIGFALGFMGYLPPGNINLTVVQLSLSHAAGKLWGFILWAMLMEFLYCFGCLLGLSFLMGKPQVVNVLQWSAVPVFAILGVFSFFHQEDSNRAPAFSGMGRGLFATVINPLQVPFWLVWGVYLSPELGGRLAFTALFALVTSTGTVGILWIYAVGGKKLVELLKLERRLLDRIIGLFLIALALLQLWKVWPKHGWH